MKSCHWITYWLVFHIRISKWSMVVFTNRSGISSYSFRSSNGKLFDFLGPTCYKTSLSIAGRVIWNSPREANSNYPMLSFGDLAPEAVYLKSLIYAVKLSGIFCRIFNLILYNLYWKTDVLTAFNWSCSLYLK